MRLTINGETYEVETGPYDLLADILHDKLGMKGTKRGCDYGGCGCCTTLVDNEAVYSCMTPVRMLVGKKITTIEGLSEGAELHPIQRAFIDHFGFQCGYCTPGFIMSAAALLHRKPNPTTDEIKEAIAGNLCRCTGYLKIIESIEAAARIMRKK
jgi:carbon-monoxide dehydrogenase small subunit